MTGPAVHGGAGDELGGAVKVHFTEMEALSQNSSPKYIKDPQRHLGLDRIFDTPYLSVMESCSLTMRPGL